MPQVHKQEQKSRKPEEVIPLAVERAIDALEKGLAVGAALDIPQEQIEAYYGWGRQFYVRGDYPAAERVFAYGFLHAGADIRFAKALAAARKMQGKYDEALKAYSLAAILDLDDPEPSFFAAECLFHLERKAAALSALDAADEQAAEAPEKYAALLPRIKKMRAALHAMPAMDA